MKNLLVLCAGNSARSILAEALFNELGKGRIRAYSAGSAPKADVHPASIKLLEAKGFATGLFRSKSWDEFSSRGAPEMDIVITVCDSAANEICPIWPGAPVQAHWGIPDPAAVEGPEQMAAFERAYEQIKARVERLLAMDFETMDGAELKVQLNAIGAEGEGATDQARSKGKA